MGTSPLASDTDGDGLSDGDEKRYGTNALKPDTDGDGYDDYEEIFVKGIDPLTPDVALMLMLIDEETELPVSNVKVLVDGKEVSMTTEEGTIHIVPLSLGKHIVSIVVPGYGSMDVGYVTIKKGMEKLTQYVDMPNPELKVSIKVKGWLKPGIPPNEVGKVAVTVANLGPVASVDTMALVIVYDCEDMRGLSQALISK